MLESWSDVTRAWGAWVLCGILAGLIPFHGVLAYGRLKSAPDPIPTRTKLRLYATIVVMEWALVAVTVAIAHRHGLTLADLGQTLANWRFTLAATTLAFLGLLLLTWFNARQVRRASREDLEATVERARKFVPVGSTEIGAFAFVALTAGICEEILYRGWLVNFLGAVFGSIWIGVIVAAILFGIGHAYQGRQGILATGFLGLVFGGMFVLLKSLVPGQALHAGIDLVNGILAGRIVKRLEREPRPSAAAEQEARPAAEPELSRADPGAREGAADHEAREAAPDSRPGPTSTSPSLSDPPA
jgi:membrane protease YdiL (CAAX protease family)